MFTVVKFHFIMEGACVELYSMSLMQPLVMLVHKSYKFIQNNLENVCNSKHVQFLCLRSGIKTRI